METIKPNELRIGNLIDTKDGIGILVHGGTIAEAETRQSSKGDTGLVGIDLTPEWLEKFGFKLGDNVTANDAFYVLPVGVSELAINPDNGVCWISNRNGSINNPACIDHVHQLQNLYFALTGQELTPNIA